MKLYIIANRLPVRAVHDNDTYKFVRSEGGLTTGLDSLQIEEEKHWIGWPGICIEDESTKQQITSELSDIKCHPVFLTDKQYREFYEGYSNSTLWPLCHYFFSYTLVKKNFWESYKEVNQLFCEEICKRVEPDDWVWVQDYQLMLLPGMLRARMPQLHIGYFHHIPFPSYELFRILPERAELLKGLLGADYIAFHTLDYMRHFIDATERVAHVKFNLEEAQIGNRIVRVDALPMGINYDLYHQSIENPRVCEEVKKYKELFGKRKLLLSVDRLDYSKGILHRLLGYRMFLEQHPEYQGKVTLSMVIVPSRDQVGSYADLKTKIDETIGAINGKFASIDWTPVRYFYHGFSFEELAALYYVADVALVTPLRDGMNLVAKEYVATKVNNPGVLVVSEMAGAAVEMTEAIQINPNDVCQIANAIYQSVTMPFEEQLQRVHRMQTVISHQTVNKWASDFMGEWKLVVDKNKILTSKRLTPHMAGQIREHYLSARNRLIMLDYDGTLVAFQPRAEQAVPTVEVLNLLERLCADPANHVVINSGRDAQTLEKWLGHLPVDFAAEHGACYKEHGAWNHHVPKPIWSEGLLSILRMFVAKTPFSYVETKATSIVWHYRDADEWLGEFRAQQLEHALLPVCLRQHLQVMQGNKVVEIKSSEFTKGSEVNRLLEMDDYDFILAMGDDITDEDMFGALPDTAVSVKIGAVSELAHYNLVHQTDTLPFLTGLIQSDEKSGTGDLFSKSKKNKLIGFFKRLFNS